MAGVFLIMRIVLNWQLGTNFGWGILGLNLFLRFCRDKNLEVMMGGPIKPKHLAGLDRLLLSEFAENFLSANKLWEKRFEKESLAKGTINIFSLGNQLHFNDRADLPGTSIKVARTIFENTNLEIHKEKLSDFDAILTGSHWNKKLLEKVTDKEIMVIHEGVDESVFFPATKSGLLPDENFYIFSGGKIEYRKGQDLVLQAFKIFAERHKDARLVVAWRSPWPHLSVGMKGVLKHELKLTDDNFLDIKRWCSENGIPEWKVIDLPIMSNYSLSQIYKEMDVGIQLSRAEACTCLPLMEMMASGVPCVASLNTGLMDLVNDNNSIPIACTDLRTCNTLETVGWGQADLEATVHALEILYQNKTKRLTLGNDAASWIRQNRRTWSQHASELKTWLLNL